jgi:hypothetical protein
MFEVPISGASHIRRQKRIAHKGITETTRYHNIEQY